MLRCLRLPVSGRSFRTEAGTAFQRRFKSHFSAMTKEFTSTPIEDTIRAKLTTSFKPVLLDIHNVSHQHSHHKAMEGVTSKETHFEVHIVSDVFKSKPHLTRHRLIYHLLEAEMPKEGGIHALQLLTRTPEEEEQARERAKQKTEADAAKSPGSS